VKHLTNRRTVYFLLLGLILATPGYVSAQNGNNNYFDTFTVYWENDVFADTDRNYTNGIKLTWSTPFLAEGQEDSHLPQWSYPVLNSLPLVNDPSTKRAISLSIGQNIYTPEDTKEKDLIEDDRPYAGYTYVAAGFHNKDARRQNSWEFDIGLVGPLTSAEEIQNFVHDTIGSPNTKGWGNQLGNELTVDIICESKWKLFQSYRDDGIGFDTFYHLGGRVGNVFTYANTGVEFRVGWYLPNNFGSCPIRAGCETNQAFNDDRIGISRMEKFNVHFFAGVDGRAVLRDMFLDGNMFQDSHSIDKEPYVADIIGGISLGNTRFKMSYAYVYRTKEFETQEKPQVFGAITISFLF
jgi:lipid A 3-O-deacylase